MTSLVYSLMSEDGPWKNWEYKAMSSLHYLPWLPPPLEGLAFLFPPYFPADPSSNPVKTTLQWSPCSSTSWGLNLGASYQLNGESLSFSI
jgi:hypothetical protein